MTITVPKMTRSELLSLADEATTTDIPTASRAFGFGANLGYALYAQGRFPCRVLRLGRKLRVPTADLLAALGLAEDGRLPADSGPTPVRSKSSTEGVARDYEHEVRRRTVNTGE